VPHASILRGRESARPRPHNTAPSDGGSVLSTPAPATASAARYALGLLVVVYIVNNIDRQIMNILIEPVRADLGLTDTQLGLLVGGAFAIFYTFAGLPIARWADRSNRRSIIALALAIWSAMTVASGLARSFGQLLLARIGVGVGEAGCTPPAHSLLSDYFPLERRGTALSIYQLGGQIGILLGLAFGGYLAETLDWRKAFFIVGAPGLLLAIIVRLTLREPARGLSDVGVSLEVEPFPAVLRFIWSLRALRHVLIATSLQTVVIAAQLTWHAPFLVRVHGMSLTEVGITLGLIAGVFGGAATFAGGYFGDRLQRRDLRWYLWLPAAGALASVPFSSAAYLAPGPNVAIALIVCATLGNHLFAALGHATIQSLAKPRMRATMSAIGLFAMNLVGFGLGPLIAGTLSDMLRPRFGEDAIRYAVLAMTVVMLWAALHYFLAARTYREDLNAKAL
jgi:MFS family permease